jgi:hypothetical protein
MGVSFFFPPFVDYVVEVFTLILLHLQLLIISSSIGCALSAPDGSSPRGYVWLLVVRHKLKVQLFSLLLASPRVQVEVFMSCNHSLLFLFFFFDIIVCCAQNLTPAEKIC